ncbi:MAG: HlyD family efflux transporter periplasmic adaptor subunit [Proteobacteria bacterium]|nr:HlyD family efflux transporter periplasmic adaptor subunit [Pseudomonadota bacterium]
MTRSPRPIAAATAIAVFTLAIGACGNASRDDGAAAKPAERAALAVARGRVDVEGGLLDLTAPRDGVVVAVDAKAGERVSAGEAILKLDPRAADLAVAAAEAELAQAKAQAGVSAARLPALAQQARRLAAAAHDGAGTGQAADEASSALDVAKAESGSAQAAVAVAGQHLAAARFEREQSTLLATAAGSVVARDVQVGDRVSASSGKVLFQILPDRPLIIHAELGEAFVDAVRPGMRAQVIPDANPARTLDARVLRIGQVFGVARRSDDPQQAPDARVVDCVLALDGGSLRIGQQVLVRIPRQ